MELVGVINYYKIINACNILLNADFAHVIPKEINSCLLIFSEDI